MEIYNLDGTIAEERQVASNIDSSFFMESGKPLKLKILIQTGWKNVPEAYISSLIDRKQ